MIERTAVGAGYELQAQPHMPSPRLRLRARQQRSRYPGDQGWLGHRAITGTRSIGHGAEPVHTKWVRHRGEHLPAWLGKRVGCDYRASARPGRTLCLIQDIASFFSFESPPPLRSKDRVRDIVFRRRLGKQRSRHPLWRRFVLYWHRRRGSSCVGSPRCVGEDRSFSATGTVT
jgi:hypothetical protein